ncbi:hypothetical protein PaeCFBP13512_18410 [Paenibacillus sp. CFBP13512]|uniref:hypothetical protein n=1 Tax=Paenibacillus sp. CFBP13512 TaxID=2184007 RepID=UPI0010C139D1|nr:hypothetical protein [Paenibacillus sp. CFBP13512]TKJ87196.1 hypothetical protein PaeCFBP13512_18410 [Paenibacillus sp. CFBP13512]
MRKRTDSFRIQDPIRLYVHPIPLTEKELKKANAPYEKYLKEQMEKTFKFKKGDIVQRNQKYYYVQGNTNNNYLTYPLDNQMIRGIVGGKKSFPSYILYKDMEENGVIIKSNVDFDDLDGFVKAFPARRYDSRFYNRYMTWKVTIHCKVKGTVNKFLDAPNLNEANRLAKYLYPDCVIINK